MAKFPIRSWRAITKMSQEELATLLGVTRVTVANWEKGVTSPRYSDLTKMAEVFHCECDDIFLPERLAKS